MADGRRPADDEAGDRREAANAAAAAERALSKVQLFSTRRPQHFTAGLASGGKNVLRGVSAGAASLVALPVMGYKSEGALGALKGFGMGLLSCTALAVGGVATGAVQVARGAINTPEAIREQREANKLWHPDRREWVDVRLPAMLEALPRDDADIINAARARKAAAGGDDASSDDGSGAGNQEHVAAASAGLPSYYEVLEVPRTATASEIRKAYAKAALKHHPDKNVGDAQAGDRFKQVGEAYRVLSDDVARAEYDRTGKRVEAGDAGERTSRMPGLALHPIQELLGGEAFLPYIGHLYLTTHFFNDQYTLSDDEAKEWHERRCLRVARTLAELATRAIELQRTDGARAVEEFFRRRTDELIAAPMGRELATIVADRIELVAERYRAILDGNLLGRGASVASELKHSAVSFGNSASLLYTTVRQLASHKQLTQDEVNPVLLRLATGDVISTVDLATNYVLFDRSVSRDESWERAEQLLRFARFMEKEAMPPALGVQPPATIADRRPDEQMN